MPLYVDKWFRNFDINDEIRVGTIVGTVQQDPAGNIVNGAMGGKLTFSTAQLSTGDLKKRVVLDNNDRMEVGNDAPFTIKRPPHTSTGGTLLSIIGQE